MSVEMQLADESDTGVKGDFTTNINNSITFVGTSTGAASISLTVGSQAVFADLDASGNWKATFTSSTGLEDGTYDMLVTALGVNGGVATDTEELIIDTTPPENPTVSLDSNSDFGNKGDLITNDQRPVFKGTAEAGFTITLTFEIDGEAYNINQSYTATVDKDGVWSFQFSESDELPADQGGNEYIFSYAITATDAAGNVSAEVQGDDITIDTIAPELSGGLSAASDSGKSSSDSITNVDQPTFSGLGDAKADVTLKINGKEYETTVNDDGVWTIEVTDTLLEGDYSYILSSTDIVGNTIDLPAQTLTIDKVADDVVISGLTSDTDSYVEESAQNLGLNDQITNNISPTIFGTAEAGSTVVLTIAGQPFNGTADADGNWQVEITGLLSLNDPASDGEYNYTVVATDIAGNPSNPEVASFTFDGTPPDTPTAVLDPASDSGSSNSDAITNDRDPIFSGTSEPNSYVILTIDGSSYSTTADDDGSWSVNVTKILSDDDYEYSVVAKDAANNQSEVFVGSFTIDTEAPSSVTGGLSSDSESGSSDSDAITNVTNPTLSGTSEPAATVAITIDGNTYSTTVDADGNWEYT